MIKLDIATHRCTTRIEFQPDAEFLGCLMTGILAAMPAFLQAFTECLSSGPPSGGFKPGDRERCN